MLSYAQPQLSPSEWRDVATALRKADEAPSPRAARSGAFGNLCSWFGRDDHAVRRNQDEGTQTIRMFVEEVRAKHRVNPGLAEMLAMRGFNDRQISALAILAH